MKIYLLMTDTNPKDKVSLGIFYCNQILDLNQEFKYDEVLSLFELNKFSMLSNKDIENIKNLKNNLLYSNKLELDNWYLYSRYNPYNVLKYLYEKIIKDITFNLYKLEAMKEVFNKYICDFKLHYYLLKINSIKSDLNQLLKVDRIVFEIDNLNTINFIYYRNKNKEKYMKNHNMAYIHPSLLKYYFPLAGDNYYK